MLIKKQVGDFTVYAAGMRQAVRRVSLGKKLQEMDERGELDDETKQCLSIYPHIFGCVEPLVSIEEFFNIPEKLLNDLSEAAMELNPHWFEIPDQEKKTEEPPILSTPDSPS